MHWYTCRNLSVSVGYFNGKAKGAKITLEKQF